MKKIVLRICGLISVGLGIAGIFLPLLPTTPFMLLALICFSKSSPELHHWLLNHPVLGKTLRDYLEHRAIKLKTKVFALSFLWISLLSSAFFVDLWWVRGILLLIGTGVTIHLVKMKTL